MEICTSIKAIKYLYKYVYKGHDRIVHAISDQQSILIELNSKLNLIISVSDEITQYTESRYISASEACWRIFHFGMQSQYPTVYPLAVHLENEQTVFLKILIQLKIR